VFAREAIKCGVDASAVLVEPEATNSGDNVMRSRALIAAKGMPTPTRLVVVQKPFMLRRAFATICKVWPELEVVKMSAERCTWAQYAVRANGNFSVLCYSAGLCVCHRHFRIVFSDAFRLRRACAAAEHVFSTLGHCNGWWNSEPIGILSSV
jgi:hypothetical protein